MGGRKVLVVCLQSLRPDLVSSTDYPFTDFLFTNQFLLVDVDQALVGCCCCCFCYFLVFVLIFFDYDDNVVETIFGSLYNYLFASGESVEVGKM